MADKRLYTIPLRDAWNVSIKKRSKRAMAVIRAFTVKHMKTDSVKIGSDLNHMIWSRGIKNPPRKVKVQMVPHKKDDTETVWVDLVTSSMDYLKEKKEKKPKVEKKEEVKPEAAEKPEDKKK
ncbi:MAG: 50S ribosomal protein L31e, partial [Candidatus Aenigmarchaeota archaeon]|nr:50S ribosomal protein L31e [Candidatus Aenigmarchaeota archaeon]